MWEVRAEERGGGLMPKLGNNIGGKLWSVGWGQEEPGVVTLRSTQFEVSVYEGEATMNLPAFEAKCLGRALIRPSRGSEQGRLL